MRKLYYDVGMKKEEFEKDIQLLKEKAPNVFHDIAYVTNPFFRLYTEIHAKNAEFLQKRFGITMSELDIMTSLFYSGAESCTLSPTQLMERILFSSGGMTKILKKLESKNLITRLENPDDGRSKLVQLNETGIALAQEGLKNLLRFEAEYFSDLNENEQAELSRLLLKSLKR